MEVLRKKVNAGINEKTIEETKATKDFVRTIQRTLENRCYEDEQNFIWIERDKRN